MAIKKVRVIQRIVVKRLDGIHKLVIMHKKIISAPLMISAPSGQLARWVKTDKKGNHFYEELE